MNPTALLFFRIVAGFGFFITLLITIFIVRHQKKLFGVDPDRPSEGSSTRSYARFLAFAALAHALVLLGALALLLH